jgi:hypothetical protein
MGLKMGLDVSFIMGIEGEKIEFIPKWLGSPSMASLDMPSLYSFKSLFGGKGS